MKTIVVTGGCGFIGSNFIRLVCAETNWRIVNFDKLTYAGNRDNVLDLPKERIRFVQGDICDQDLVGRSITEESVWALVNFAAESHVDRSILDSSPFLQTNIVGTQTLLEAIRKNPVERFLHVSTDEVYGDKEGKAPSSEGEALLPSSPYAASKAAADLLCFSYHRTYDVPVIITRSTNNYGPYQFPEKLIPLMIIKALRDEPLPVYGDGKNVRDWIQVDDHCAGIVAALFEGKAGSVYNFGGNSEMVNLDLVRMILDRLGKPHSLISFVPDRLGHDRRYAIDSAFAQRELGWKPLRSFNDGLNETIQWYMDNPSWWHPLLERTGRY
jgi:dTDP-glucose 4,6-dehydratase